MYGSRKKGNLRMYAVPDTPGALEEEAKNFCQLVQDLRQNSLLKATKFECAVLNRAISEGPERLAEAVRHFNEQSEHKNIIRLARYAERLLPFINKDELLSEWSTQHIRRYLVRGRINGECEVRLQETVRFMTYSFLVSELIKVAQDSECWASLVEQMKKSLEIMRKEGILVLGGSSGYI